MVRTLIGFVIIIIILGGTIKLFRLNEIDVCDNDDLIQNITESGWSVEGGRQGIQFNEDNTFVIRRPFNNDGIKEYHGKFTLIDDCKVIFPNAKWLSEFDGVMSRHIELEIITNGELSRKIGSTLKIDFADNRYTSFSLNGTTYLKTSKFEHLTSKK